jgi:hypothetical protein
LPRIDIAALNCDRYQPLLAKPHVALLCAMQTICFRICARIAAAACDFPAKKIAQKIA